MDSLLSIMAARTATSALELGGKAVAAAAKPFDLLLQAAANAAKPADVVKTSPAEAEATLEDRVAAQLQELLESCGLESGERVELSIDPAAGEIAVSDSHPAKADIERALEQRPELLDDLEQLAELNAAFGEGFGAEESEVAVEVGNSGEAARLEWRIFS
jgi:hypothetical protein